MRLPLREIIEVLRVRDDPPRDYEALADFAEFAFNRCVQWFGPPSDLDCPYEIWKCYYNNLSYCGYNRLLRRYIIAVSENNTDAIARLEIVAHEVFHRVTWGRPGLRQQIWVNEMMAHLVSQKCLVEKGYSEYVQRRKSASYRKTPIIKATAIREQPRSHWTAVEGLIYPKDFYPQVIRLGYTLSSLLYWEDMTSIIKAKTLEEWIGWLPVMRQPLVRRVLELPDDTLRSQPSPKARLQAGIESYLKNDMDAAIRELREVIRLHPACSKAYICLGMALQCDGKIEEALVILHQATYLCPRDAYPYLLLGNTYRTQGDLNKALEWLRKAEQIEPENESIPLVIAAVMEEKGDSVELRAAIEKVLALPENTLVSE